MEGLPGELEGEGESLRERRSFFWRGFLELRLLRREGLEEFS